MRKKILSYAAAVALTAGFSLAGLTSQAKAQSAVISPGVTLSIGYKGEHFHYGETIGDQEHGWLNGVYGKLDYKTQNNVLGLGNLYLGLHTSYLGGSVTYDGALQDIATGQTIPYSTNTDEGIFQIEAQGGFDQALSNKVGVGEYVLLGYRYWNRDMKGIGGYTEDYNNGYIGLGVKGDVAWSNQFKTGLDLSYRMSPSWGSINYMSSPFGNFNMGYAYNMHLAIPISYNFTKQFSVNLTPYYDYWHFSGSGVKNVSIDGYSAYAYEPSSETNALGINGGISYRF